MVRCIPDMVEEGGTKTSVSIRRVAALGTSVD
jgi:hypothetical protein